MGGQTGEELVLGPGPGGVRLEERLDIVGSSPITARKVTTRVLNLIWAVMGSQWKEMRSGVTWERLGRLKTRWVSIEHLAKS